MSENDFYLTLIIGIIWFIAGFAIGKVWQKHKMEMETTNQRRKQQDYYHNLVMDFIDKVAPESKKHNQQ